jgi:hypothetical protein
MFRPIGTLDMSLRFINPLRPNSRLLCSYCIPISFATLDLSLRFINSLHPNSRLLCSYCIPISFATLDLSLCCINSLRPNSRLLCSYFVRLKHALNIIGDNNASRPQISLPLSGSRISCFNPCASTMVHSVYAPSPTTSNKSLPSENPRAGSPETMSGVMDKPAQVPARFSMSSLAALHLSSFAQGFSNGERQAAARALLKHEAHVDGTHYHTRKPGGLHPSHIAFNSYTSSNEPSITQEDFLNAALQDLFDAVSFFYFLSSYTNDINC